MALSKARCAAILITASVFSGCSDNISQPAAWYTTNTIYAYMKAVQDEGGAVTTTVELRNGSSSSAAYLYLSKGESLYNSLDKAPSSYLSYNDNLFGNSINLSQELKRMAVRDLYISYILFDQIAYGSPEYYAAITPTSGLAPTRAYVAYERSGQVMAGESWIDLPPAYQILSPVYDSTLSRSSMLTLSWSNSDPTSTMELVSVGDCADGSRYIINPGIGITTDPATGISSTTLSSSDYFNSAVATPSTNCRVALILKRVKIGGVSPNFAFGSFKGIQQRTVQFTSIP